MKIRCSCGAKFEFDLAPDMAHRPVQFVCPACGQDASDFVNNLIRQELGADAPSAGAPPASAPLSAGAPPASPLLVRMPALDPKPGPVSAEVAEPPQICLKHPGQVAIEKCYVCSKPICPKCMELFGYVCSPLCKAKADSHGIQVPIYQGQRAVAEARTWRWTARVATGIFLVALLAGGFWFWYAWFGSTPKTLFSVRFSEPAYSGQSIVRDDQLIVLHGITLARYDLKQKKEVWSRQLIEQKQIDEVVANQTKAIKAIIDRASNENPDNVPKMPAPDKLARNTEREMAAARELVVRGHNVWVASPGKLARYDWLDGKPITEIPIKPGVGPVIPRGDELLLMESDSGKSRLTHINLNTCDSRSEELGGTEASFETSPTTIGRTAAGTGARTPRTAQTAGLPVGMPGKDAGKPLDPGKVAEQAQHLPLPAKIALPAVLAGNLNQERALNELDDHANRASGTAAQPTMLNQSFSLVPTDNGCIRFTVRLLEQRIVSRNAMKAPSVKSVLDRHMSVAQTTDAANEILNEMQRSRGADTVQEDQSRYLVTIQSADGRDEWSGEVTGPPALHPLKTVNVLIAGKLLLVFDKTNKKLWQSALNYKVPGDSGALDEGMGPFGQGPCVERKNTVYVFDEGVLTAFDLAAGNVRWRLPSVGIAGIFFDDKDMMYVNSTTATPERIKYSRQIDISQKATSIVLKLNPKNGKVLWTAQPGGLVTYVSGKYVFALQSYHPDEEDEENPYMPETGFEAQPYLRIKRLNPTNGHTMWEHFQQRAPLDVRFDQNSIELVFKKEAQVLRFLAF